MKFVNWHALLKKQRQNNGGLLMPDVLTVEQRKKNMQNIRCKDTRIERVLRQALWNKGYRYRKNYKNLSGKPDIVFTKYKIAIFCDGEFFHGKDWDILKTKMKESNNGDFWIKKIEGNIKRDQETNQKLESLGWHVIRFWGKDILKNTNQCVGRIEDLIHEIKSESED